MLINIIQNAIGVILISTGSMSIVCFKSKYRFVLTTILFTIGQILIELRR